MLMSNKSVHFRDQFVSLLSNQNTQNEGERDVEKSCNLEQEEAAATAVR